MTAENAVRDVAPQPPAARFNEAAADDRGKHGRARSARHGPRRFNEAAADDRGKPPEEEVTDG